MIDLDSAPPFPTLYRAPDGRRLDEALTSLARDFHAGRAGLSPVVALRDHVSGFFRNLHVCPSQYKVFWEQWWARNLDVFGAGDRYHRAALGGAFLRWLLATEEINGPETQPPTQPQEDQEGPQDQVRDDRPRRR